MSDQQQVLITALKLAANGCTVVPTRKDGGKAPALAWKDYQTNPPTKDEILRWFAQEGHTGLGIITGKASGNLELLELEGRAVEEGLDQDIETFAYHAGLEELWDRLWEGWVERSPSGGIHWFLRISDHDVPGNTKLAVGSDNKVLAETRGEGGFCVVAPSYGNVHETNNPWEVLTGGPENIVTLTWAERNAFVDLLRSISHQQPWQEDSDGNPLPKPPTRLQPTGDRPGDEYAAAVTWDEILAPHNWRKIFTDSKGVSHWRRPGKDAGTSATTGYTETGNLYVFSTNAHPFEGEQSYSKFAAYAILNHGGDYQAASRQLRAEGYGLEINQLATFTPEPVTPIYKDTYNGLSVVPDTPEIVNPEPINPDTETTINSADHTARLLERHIANELLIGRAKREAKKELDAQDAASTYTPPVYIPTLTDELALPDEEIAWAIQDLLPHGGNALLTAAYKSGKTTMINHLIKCFADGHNFVGKFPIPKHPRRIVVFNYEVGAGQYRRWLKDVNIEHTEKITLVHLRGQRLPLISKPVEDLIVHTLRELDAHTWVIDPFARAFTGCGDENSNSDVGVFLDTLDVIKERAGVANLIMAAHTGRAIEHGIERARGATRLDDWADVRWTLVKDDEGNRFFSADGRDVSVDEERVAYDEAKRSLKMGGHDRKGHKRVTEQDAVLAYIGKNGGATFAQVQTGSGLSEHATRKAIKDLEARKKIVVQEGDGRAKLHFMVGAVTPWKPELAAKNA